MFHLLGVEGQTSFHSLRREILVESESYDYVLHRLNMQLDYRVKVVDDRIFFAFFVQKFGESADGFVVGLRRIAESCQLGTFPDVFLRYQFEKGKKNYANVINWFIIKLFEGKPLDC